MSLVKKLKNKFLKEASGKESFTTTDMSNNTITINKTDYDKLQTKNSELQIEIKELKFENLVLQERVDLLTYKRFVHSAENIDDKQGLLFNEDEAIKAETQNECDAKDKTNVNSYTRKKGGRKPLPENLERKVILNDLPEEQKHCTCGRELVEISRDVNEKLVFVPASIYVERLVTPNYVCPCCSKAKEKTANEINKTTISNIISNPIPPAILPGSIASPQLLAHTFIAKFCDGLPYYRLEKQFKRIGVTVSRQDMANWQVAVFERLPILFLLLMQHIKTGKVLRMDETTVQVMGEEGRDDRKKSYIWLARGGPPDKIATIFKYHPTRASENIDEFLSDFKGYLQTDGYAGYDCACKNYPDIIQVACFAHARRKFFEALKVSSQKKSAAIGIKYIQKLYNIENNLRDKLHDKELSDDDFVEQRKEQTKPIFDDFKKWGDKLYTKTKAETLIQKAVNYTHNQWNKLIAYVDDIELTPDNNLSENAIRPFVIGRKNWLFFKSSSGAKSACALYSLIETAKCNDVDPAAYLTYLFNKAPTAITNTDWDALLPWNVKFDDGKN